MLPQYLEHDIDAPKYLDGMFSWVLHDKIEDRIVAARDPIGITTFYMGRSSTTPVRSISQDGRRGVGVVIDEYRFERR